MGKSCSFALPTRAVIKERQRKAEIAVTLPPSRETQDRRVFPTGPAPGAAAGLEPVGLTPPNRTAPRHPPAAAAPAPKTPPTPRPRHSPVGVLQHAEVLARPPLHVCNRPQTPVTDPPLPPPAPTPAPAPLPAVPGLYQRVKYRSAPPPPPAAAMPPAPPRRRAPMTGDAAAAGSGGDGPVPHHSPLGPRRHGREEGKGDPEGENPSLTPHPSAWGNNASTRQSFLQNEVNM